jgi:hypothetical protein
LDDPNGDDACVSVGKDNILRDYDSHVVVESVPAIVLASLGRPHVTAANLIAPGLILVYPPVAHNEKPDLG